MPFRETAAGVSVSRTLSCPAGIHAPLLAVKGLAGLPVLIASVVASLVFVPLIARLKRGVAFSFCVHHLFYVLAGLALRVGL